MFEEPSDLVFFGVPAKYEDNAVWFVAWTRSKAKSPSASSGIKSSRTTSGCHEVRAICNASCREHIGEYAQARAALPPAQTR